MAEDVGSIAVTLTAFTQEFSRKMEEANARLASVQTAVEKAGTATEDAGAKAGLSAAIWIKAFDLAAGAVAALYDAIKEGIGDALKAEEVDARLAVTLQSLGENSAEVSKLVDEQATRLQQLTGVSDDAVKAAYTLALQFGEGAYAAMDLIDVAAALSDVTGNDLQQSMQALLKTKQGVIDKTLALVPGIKDLTEEQLRNGEAIALVNDHYAKLVGSADGAWRSARDLSTEFGEFFEAIGKGIIQIEAVRAAIDAVTLALRGLSKLVNDGGIGNMIGGVVAGIAEGFGIDTGLDDFNRYEAKIALLDKQINDASRNAGRAAEKEAQGINFAGAVGTPEFTFGKASSGTKTAKAKKDDPFDFSGMSSADSAFAAGSTQKVFDDAIKAEADARTSAAATWQREVSGQLRGYLDALEADTRAAEQAAAEHEAMMGSLAQTASNLVGGLGDMGSLAQSVMQGFEQGGPFGALAAGAAALISRTEAFGQIVEGLNGLFGQIVEQVEPLVEAIMPIVEIAAELAGVLIQALGPVLKIFGLQLRALAEVLRGVSAIMLYVIRGLGWAWNKIIGAVQWVLRKIDNVIPGDKLDNLAEKLEGTKVNLEALDDAIKAVTDDTWDDPSQVGSAANGAAGALDNLGDAADEVSGALLNVPTGFKIAKYAYDASDAEAPWRDLKAAGMGKSILINVVAHDTREAARAIRRELERDNFVSTGSVFAGHPYAALKVTTR